MKLLLENIKKNAEKDISSAKNQKDIEEIKVKYLGKKGELTNILKQMGKLSAEEKPVIGQLANEVRNFINQNIDSNIKKIKKIELDKQLYNEKIDVIIK